MTGVPLSLTRFRTRTWYVHVTLAVAMVIIPFAYFVAIAPSTGQRTVGVVGVVAGLALAVRMCMASLSLDDSGVHLVRTFSTLHIPLGEVRSVHVVQSGKSSAKSVALAVGRAGGLVRAPMTACSEAGYTETLGEALAAFESRGISIHHR